MAERQIPSSATLTKYIKDREDTPFEWGVNDCCTFAADFVLLATGIDPMEGLRGFMSAKAALRRLQSLGGIATAVTSRLGANKPVAFAMQGDIVLLPSGKEPRTLGICIGRLVAAPGHFGVVMIPVYHGVMAWHV